MNTHEIKVPQLGEGLREVTIVALLKEPGEWVERDEPIAEVETEKSTVMLEAPVSGTIAAWSCKAGDTIAIGAILTSIQITN